jgi:excisionase family DNA binding protein
LGVYDNFLYQKPKNMEIKALPSQRGLIRTTEAIELLGISKTKFWNLVKAGVIPTVRPFGPTSRLIYVPKAELARFFS